MAAMGDGFFYNELWVQNGYGENGGTVWRRSGEAEK